MAKKSKGNAEKVPGVENNSDVSRRGFLGGAAVGGLTAASLGFGPAQISAAEAHGSDHGAPRSGGSRDRVLLKGGVVLSLDPAVGDFEKADVLIEGKKIIAVRPNIHANAKVVDCSGMIVMPGFVSTHCHQYDAVQRSNNADGLILFAADADQQKTVTATNFYEAYGTVVTGIWTGGRIGSGTAPVWDLGRSPYEPEDCYNSELISCLAQITQGITCGTDTSQCSQTPQHTDGMIKACIDSGRRTLYSYAPGTNREPNQATPPAVPKRPYNVATDPYEYPGAVLYPGQKMGLERIAKKWFSSKDQLVTLGFGGNSNVINNLPAPYTGMRGWTLGREFDAFMSNHSIADPQTAINALANGLAPFHDITLIHCVRWQENSVAQISHSHLGYPTSSTSEGMRIWADNGGHVSIAPIIEPQMRHGAPPFQMCLNYGILPSLSPDVECNMTTDPFSMMRGAFTMQRGYANDLAFSATSDPGNLPIPQLVTCEQVVQMMTIGGAAGCGLLNKVGTLTPGKEADIVMLDYNSIQYQPMNNAYGSVVTMMDTSAVKHVMVAGKIVYWNRKLVGWDVDKVIKKAVRSRDNMLERIRGQAFGSDIDMINRGMNSEGHPYRPAFLKSCCHKGLNEFAPQYVLRP